MENQFDETLAHRLCREAHVDFFDTFRNQFIITQDTSDAITGFIHTPIGGWHIYSGPDVQLCCATVGQGAVQVAMLGVAVDADGLVLTPGNFAAKMAAIPDFDSAVADLLQCAGRYAFVVIGDGRARMYGDAGNTLGFVYNTQVARIASSLHLALRRRINHNKDYPFARQAALGAGPRFAFGHTADAHVRRPLANHFLDMNAMNTHRFWPTEDTVLTISPDDHSAQEAALDVFIRRHQQVMQSLTAAFTPSILPLSGGRETRILLASSLDCVDQVDMMFTHAANWISLLDMAAGRQMAKAVGRRLHEIYGKEMLKWEDCYPTWQKQLTANKLAMGNLPRAATADMGRHIVSTVLPRGGIVLRGYVTDLLKAVLWERGVVHHSQGLPHNNRHGLQMLFLSGNNRKKGLATHGPYWNDPWFKNAYASWRDTLPQSATGRIYDLQFMEHFQPHGHGELFYCFRDNFYIGPGNDRAVMQAAMSLPPEARRDLVFHKRLYEKIAPNLGKLPYNNDFKEMPPEQRKTYHSALG